MATTTYSPAYAASARRPSRIASIPSLARSFVNAVAAARIRRAQAELRRHEIAIRESSIVYGPYRAVRLEESDLLPFNS